ncbi:MAG: HNH endonuclease [Gemmataceae bacterium]
MTIISESLRSSVATRAGDCCEYCLLPSYGQVGRFPIDHIIPRVLGGRTELTNLAFACPHCNAHKWAHVDGIDPHTGQTAPLFNPRLQLWSEHLEWSSDNPYELQGKSPCGRATISRLQMNHADLMAVRRLLAGLKSGPVTS